MLKKDSPSRGLERVRVRHGASLTRSGRGLFSEALLNALPALPIEEEGRLHRYSELGRLVAGVAAVPRREFESRYRTMFVPALSRPATRGRRADVMLHILGHFKRLLDPHPLATSLLALRLRLPIAGPPGLWAGRCRL